MSHPIHYLIDLYKELNKLPGMEVMVYFCSDFGIKSGFDKSFRKAVKWYDKEILNGLPHKFLKNYSLGKNIGGFFSIINPQIIFELKRNHYDAILIHGYNYFTNIAAILAANIFKIPVLFRGESHLLNNRSLYLSKFKNLFLPILFKKIAAFLAIGSLNADYYKFYRVGAQKIFLAPYAANNSHLKKLNEQLDKKNLKRKCGLNSESTVILYLAKLIKRKRPLDLIRAYEIAKEKIKNNRAVELVFVGDGPERESLEKYAKENELQDIHFFGFKKPEELPEFYKMADIFVLPSSFETWGMVINEAMNFGLPIIATDMVGAAYDLVKTGENGFIYECGNINKLANYIQKLIEDEMLRRKMSVNSLAFIENWGYEEDIKKILEVLENFKNEKVIVANPGSHHLWRTAVAFQNADLLKYYATGIYYLPHKFPYNFLKIMPGKWRTKITDQLKKRSYGDLNKSRIKTFGFYEWLNILIERLFKSKKLSHFLINIRNKNFSLKTGKLALKEASLLWGALDGSREAFLLAKKAGIVCILDQFIGHPLALNKILKEEVEIHPELKNVTKDIISSQKLERLCQEIQLADIIVVGSEFAKKTLWENGVSPTKIFVIPYGADDIFFKNKPIKRENDKFFNILFVGNISVRKGSYYLLKAAQELDSSRFKLRMVGQMEDKYFLKKFGDYFEWIPKVDPEEIPKFYKEAHVYVYPSLFEGSSLSIYEAMASGLPIITTENSGSVVRDKKDGFIIPIRDVKAIKEKIMLFYQDRNLLSKMSENAREQARNFTWEVYQTNVAVFVKKLIR